MNIQCMQGLVSILLLGTMGFETTYAQPPAFSSFEYNQASNTVFLEWLNSTNAFYEMQASTNLMTGLWGQEGGWTNILGTNPTNSVILPADDHPNVFFRLLARTNSPQASTFHGVALRANTDLLSVEMIAPWGSFIYFWDNDTFTYQVSSYTGVGGWTPYFSITNNQSFFYSSSTADAFPAEWTHAYVKDWRLISPADLPVTGNVLIEWAAFESYSTPSNPIPDIPFVNVTIKNSDQMVVTNWFIEAPVSSSVIWNSNDNPAGYYMIEVDVANFLETIEKQIYLYK